MENHLLSFFPPFTHPLTLVSDPDRLMAGETIILELTNLGFRFIQEEDPVFLHHRVEAARPFTSQQPLIIVTSGSLEALPYSLFQSAHRVTLSYHQFFPNLSYPVLQTLSPPFIEKLADYPQPAEPLSRKNSITYLLREVFNADSKNLSQPYQLIAWLNEYHRLSSSLPETLLLSLITSLKTLPVYQKWDLEACFRDAQFFSNFIQDQWDHSIQPYLPNKTLKEPPAEYLLPFAQNPQLQNLIPMMVRQGTLKPTSVPEGNILPDWVSSGITVYDTRLQRIELLIADLKNQLIPQKLHALQNWQFWAAVAHDWSVLSSLIYQPNLEISEQHKNSFQNLIRQLDDAFTPWLTENYPALGVQRLPQPHHVFHIPHYLAYLRSIKQIDKVALFVLDGLSLTDWQTIKPVWGNRHPNWQFKTNLVLAQVPTITSISRYALISGLRPVDFIKTEPKPSEARAWELFWSREGFSKDSSQLMSLSYDRQINQLPELLNPQIQNWCLIDDTPDKLTHHATLGAADQQSTLGLWLDPNHDQNTTQLEAIMDKMLDLGFSVFITSDHGHVEATGFGKPSEGLLAQTRGKRARIYQDDLTAASIQNAFVNTILWKNDGLLPDQMLALMPAKRQAFTTSGEVVVTHGGISLEEIIVPLIKISKVKQ